LLTTALPLTTLLPLPTLSAQEPLAAHTQLAHQTATRPTPPSQATLRQQLQAKKLQPMFRKAAWTFDYEQALAEAKATGKPVFAYFTRSYAPCQPCIALENSAFLDAEFAALCKDVVLFCHITSQVDGEPHAALLREKGGTEFPYVAFLDADGNVISKEKQRTVAGFRASTSRIARLRELAPKAATEPAAAAEMLATQLQLGAVLFVEAQQRAATWTNLPDATRRILDQALIDAEVDQWITQSHGKDATEAANERLLAMLAAHLIPSGETARLFFSRVLFAASERRDATAYRAALDGLKQQIGADRRFVKTIEVYEQQLQKLSSQVASPR
jgi:hypothetical protein